MEWTIPTTDFANLYGCVFAWIIQSFKRTNELFNTSSGSVAKVLKEAGARVCSIKKKIFAKFAGIFFELCQIFKNIYLEEYLWAADSVFANS